MSSDFVDFYEILQVRPTCSAKTLEAAYRFLAKKYHPDHPETADIERFNEVVAAYKILRSPEKRAQYDQDYVEVNGAYWLDEDESTDVEIDEAPALDDADAHSRILLLLYKKRRENAQKAGVVAFYLQDMLNCSDEHFEFHKWYLKEKGFIELTEQGTLAITIEGVDHVISMSRTRRAEKLLIGDSRGDPGGK